MWKRGTSVITHGGLNTVLESLREAVPMVAIPLDHDQPGVAARAKAHGAAAVVPRGRLSAARLHDALAVVLEDARYAASARLIADNILGINGPALAAEIVEQALRLNEARCGAPETIHLEQLQPVCDSA